MKTTKMELRSGYIALSAALIIMAFILILSAGAATTAYLGRSTVADPYRKDQSRALAESCVEAALLELANSGGYAGGEVLTVATSTLRTDTCNILPVLASSTSKIIRAEAVFGNAATNIQAVVDADLRITSWEEVRDF